MLILKIYNFSKNINNIAYIVTNIFISTILYFIKLIIKSILFYSKIKKI